MTTQLNLDIIHDELKKCERLIKEITPDFNFFISIIIEIPSHELTQSYAEKHGFFQTAQGVGYRIQCKEDFPQFYAHLHDLYYEMLGLAEAGIQVK